MDVRPLSQRDNRWANKKLGFSSLSIGKYGCTLTALTCLINYVEGKNYTPDQVNEMLKKANAFSGSLIWWERVPRAFPSLRWTGNHNRGYNYNNAIVAWNVYIKGMPVMVEVNAAKIGATKHWVLFIGGQKAIDPWTGNIISTSFYPCTGYAVFQKS